MKPLFLTVALLAVTALSSQTRLPRRIYVENAEKSSHVQGIAIDTLRGYAYFSFTTSLIKTDLEGRVVGSVTGLTCHLGCLDLDEQTGKVYASVEYKNDEIGRGIMHIMGKPLGKRDNTFYIGIFDTDKIDRVGIDAQTGGVMRTVFLPQVARFYEDTVVNQGRRVAHRYGCSGIDGIALGPQFGKPGGPKRLYIDVAVYGDTTRTDNDYQMFLEYDLKTLNRYARPLDQSNPHRTGPKRARRQLFVFTGNTSYGVQNLEYDRPTAGGGRPSTKAASRSTPTSPSSPSTAPRNPASSGSAASTARRKAWCSPSPTPVPPISPPGCAVGGRKWDRRACTPWETTFSTWHRETAPPKAYRPAKCASTASRARHDSPLNRSSDTTQRLYI